MQKSAESRTALADVRARSQREVRRSIAIGHRLEVARARNVALRDAAAALRLARHDFLREPGMRATEHQPISRFSLRGMIGGEAVGASWDAGRLRCDDALFARAGLLVRIGERFEVGDSPFSITACLHGAPRDVMLTLARACDRVTALTFEVAVSG